MDGFGNEGRADGELHPGAGTGHEPEKAERPEASRHRRKGVDEHVEEHREGEYAAPHPKNPRFSNSVSSRSVLARRCSRDTATLEGWITCASTPRAFSQRANQKPSRP